MTANQGRMLCADNPQARGGTLSISGGDLHEHRWCLNDLTDLWEESQRGDDVEISGYDGVIPFARRFAATRYLLPLAITGWVDAANNPAAVPMNQLRLNLKAFKAAFVGPVGDDGDRPIVYVPPDGTETWTSIAQVLDIRKDGTVDGIWHGNLELTLLRPWTVT
jgi:hypothetical protein